MMVKTSVKMLEAIALVSLSLRSQFMMTVTMAMILQRKSSRIRDVDRLPQSLTRIVLEDRLAGQTKLSMILRALVSTMLGRNLERG